MVWSPDGEVGVFTWTLGDVTWDYAAVTGIPDTATLVGSVSGYYDKSTPALTLLVGSLDGAVYELVGDAFDTSADWTVGLFDA